MGGGCWWVQYRGWWWRRAALGQGPLVVHERVEQRVGRTAVVRLRHVAPSLRQLEGGIRRDVLGGFCGTSPRAISAADQVARQQGSQKSQKLVCCQLNKELHAQGFHFGTLFIFH